MTYGGGDTERATVLTYSDVQKFLKRVRKAGHKPRYLVSGEYGSTKGRAHWHIILWFDGAYPALEMRKEKYAMPFWDHGYSYVDDVNASSARYVCKYVIKDDGDQEAQALFRQSRQPPIGTEYFYRLAKWHVANGLPPQNLIYRFDENRDTHGRRVQHFMHGATARDFLQAYIDLGGKYLGEAGWGFSALVSAFADKQVREAPELVLERRRYLVAPIYFPSGTDRPNRDTLTADHQLNTYVANHNGERLAWWPLDFNNPNGEFAWRVKGQGTTIRWQDSDRLRALQREAAEIKAQADRANELWRRANMRTPSEMRSDEKARSQRLKGRLPMVGDHWQ